LATTEISKPRLEGEGGDRPLQTPSSVAPSGLTGARSQPNRFDMDKLGMDKLSIDAGDPDAAKRRAAAAALELVRPGMRLGLGTGTTAAHFIAQLGAKVAEGLRVTCVPTSERTRAQAEALGIPLLSFEEIEQIDLTVDGADEFDPQLRLMKGGGGALWREKIVAAASKRMIVITDASKEVAVLGKFPLPIEISRFGCEATRAAILREARLAGCDGIVTMRKSAGGEAFTTDNGNYLVDCALGAIPSADDLAQRLSAIPGIVEHGLFIGLATAVISAETEGIKIFGHLD
jgi:ribose 5-phosphate isomerase A